MFETAELGRKIAKADYTAAVPPLRSALLAIQNELAQARTFSVVVVIAGVEGAGKGATVNVLHEWMDPRFLETHAYGPASDEERERPPMWRFWRDLPPRGRLGIYFGSWYTGPILTRVAGQTNDDGLDAALNRINSFERGLSDDGTLLLKYWFHLSRKAQKRRLKSLSKDPEQSWRVTERDRQLFAKYDQFIPVCERAVRATSTGAAPWTVVEGQDRRYRELTVARHMLAAIGDHLERSRRRQRATKKKRAKRVAAAKPQPTILDTVDTTAQLSETRYRKTLLKRQGELSLLSRDAHAHGITTLMVFEGWDAAGKGGAIRRVARAVDARGYQVVPIAAPTDEENSRHYLWRFWRHLPRAGKILIFDRSWYGRVLVERVEGFATRDEIRRAYMEINEFEEELAEHGIALVKFWLHISKDEQLRRFREREKTPYKQYKITRDDWRNRERWTLYEQAVNEMVGRTSTSFAPWTLVAANDKRHARVVVLETAVATIAAAVKRANKRRHKR